MSKYEALTSFLNHQVTDEITVSFEDLGDEDRIGIALPPSAKLHRQWWENQVNEDGRQCRAWLDAGFEVSDVNFTHEHVTFRRTKR